MMICLRIHWRTNLHGPLYSTNIVQKNLAQGIGAMECYVAWHEASLNLKSIAAVEKWQT